MSDAAGREREPTPNIDAAVRKVIADNWSAERPIPLWMVSIYRAGIKEGRRLQSSDDREDARSSATEAMWKERQGEDYGSY